MQVQDITSPVSTILFDNTNVRWSITELTQYVNDGQRAIVLLRPDANAENKSVRLISGTKQAVPTDGISFINMTRNMGSDGNTPGRAVRIASREALDNEAPDWHYNNFGTVLEHYVFDKANPLVFYVYPGVKPATTGQPNGSTSNVWCEIIYSQIPTKVANLTDVLDLPDHYGPALQEYVLHRAYSKDASYAGNAQRAATHLQNFANGLQISMQVLVAMMPTPQNQGAVNPA